MKCSGCCQLIDETTCHCGEDEKSHEGAEHGLVPMGCMCGYEQKVFEIWCEGFAITGNRAGASRVGVMAAANFKVACDKLYDGNPHYDRETTMYWGCRLFDNEKEARELFG